MIYITGDTHGNWISRFCEEAFPEQKSMTKNDYVIVCGDFGIWDNSKYEKKNLKWLDQRTFTTLFVAGNHSNFDILNSYNIEYWNGGKVHFICPSVIHLMRGQVFEIEGKHFFTIGGASCHDNTGGVLDKKESNYEERKNELEKAGLVYRVNHESWWKEELPSEEELQEGITNLKINNYDIDFVITHCGASDTVKNNWSEYRKDILTDYLESVKCRFINQNYKWFMGHYHENKKLNNHEYVLYEQIIRIL